MWTWGTAEAVPPELLESFAAGQEVGVPVNVPALSDHLEPGFWRRHASPLHAVRRRETWGSLYGEVNVRMTGVSKKTTNRFLFDFAKCPKLHF